MTEPSQELILVVPTATLERLGLFQGFCADVERYLPRLLAPDQIRYLPRAAAEHDPRFKQIVPYVVLRWQDQVFHYTRGRGGAEKRLHARRSIGVGGHVHLEDQTHTCPYRQAMLREIEEEVFLDSRYTERCLGLIHDDRTPVGQVHLGVAHVFELDEPRVRRREAVLTHSGFAPLTELHHQREEFETWSQFVMDVLLRQEP
ncbi:MAG: phosphoesterase [Gemmataceae bacterium]